MHDKLKKKLHHQHRRSSVDSGDMRRIIRVDGVPGGSLLIEPQNDGDSDDLYEIGPVPNVVVLGVDDLVNLRSARFVSSNTIISTCKFLLTFRNLDFRHQKKSLGLA